MQKDIIDNKLLLSNCKKFIVFRVHNLCQLYQCEHNWTSDVYHARDLCLICSRQKVAITLAAISCNSHDHIEVMALCPMGGVNEPLRM